MSLIRLIAKLHSFLFHPARVAAACATLFFSMLLFNGTFIRLWGLRRDNYQLEQQIRIAKNDIADLNRQLRQAKDPQFIEKVAMDRLDLASEDDLVFVFAEN